MQDKELLVKCFPQKVCCFKAESYDKSEESLESYKNYRYAASIYTCLGSEFGVKDVDYCSYDFDMLRVALSCKQSIILYLSSLFPSYIPVSRFREQNKFR